MKNYKEEHDSQKGEVDVSITTTYGQLEPGDDDARSRKYGDISPFSSTSRKMNALDRSSQVEAYKAIVDARIEAVKAAIRQRQIEGAMISLAEVNALAEYQSNGDPQLLSVMQAMILEWLQVESQIFKANHRPGRY